MNRIRTKFIRGEEVKFISHLDLMKVFERALRRADISIAYSQGFNPHPQMVFGLPLSVGVTSEAEYADFEIVDDLEPQIFSERLNASLPEGLRITKAVIKNTKDNIMATITAASYDMLFCSAVKPEETVISKKTSEFLNKEVITAKKVTKNGEKDIDIRPLIHKVDYIMLEDMNKKRPIQNIWMQEYINKLPDMGLSALGYNLDNLFCLSVLLSAGSAANLKPELLASAYNEFTDLGLKLIKVHRTGLFITKDNILSDPLI